MNTPTPETDAIHLKQGLSHAEYRKHAQKLERERNEIQVRMECELAAAQINLENLSRSHFEMGELMQAKISDLESKNLELIESLQGIIDECGCDLPVWRVEDAVSAIAKSNQP